MFCVAYTVQSPNTIFSVTKYKVKTKPKQSASDWVYIKTLIEIKWCKTYGPVLLRQLEHLYVNSVYIFSVLSYYETMLLWA